MRLEVLRHTDTVIFHAENKGRIPTAGRRLFFNADIDGTARRCKLDSVAHDVEQDLIQAQLIGDNILVVHILRVDVKVKLFGADIALNDRAQVVQHIGQVDFCVVQFDRAAFDTAHIQNIVDQTEQMLARYADFLQILFDKVNVINMRRGKGRKPDNGIHRGANIVRHTVQEYSLGLIGVFRRRQCIAQGIFLLLLPPLFLGSVAGGNQHGCYVAVRVFSLRCDQRKDPFSVDSLRRKSQRGVTLQTFGHCRHVRKGEILLTVWLRDNFLDLLLLYGSFQCKVLLLLDRIGRVLEDFNGVFLQVHE